MAGGKNCAHFRYFLQRRLYPISVNACVVNVLTVGFGYFRCSAVSADVPPKQAIARQWPLIERHAWAIRVPERPLADLGKPFEVWYAPGHMELSASLNNPSVEFTRARDPET